MQSAIPASPQNFDASAAARHYRTPLERWRALNRDSRSAQRAELQRVIDGFWTLWSRLGIPDSGWQFVAAVGVAVALAFMILGPMGFFVTVFVACRVYTETMRSAAR